MKFWHPHIKDLCIERDESEVAAFTAAGWLKGKPKREYLETAPDESLEEAVEEAREEKPAKAKSNNAGKTSTGDGEDK